MQRQDETAKLKQKKQPSETSKVSLLSCFSPRSKTGYTPITTEQPKSDKSRCVIS